MKIKDTYKIFEYFRYLISIFPNGPSKSKKEGLWAGIKVDELTIRCDNPYDESSMLVKKAEIPKDREERRELARLVNKPEGITIFR